MASEDKEKFKDLAALLQSPIVSLQDHAIVSPLLINLPNFDIVSKKYL
jgi:hypothetical protein